jgi:hypothetical protein
MKWILHLLVRSRLHVNEHQDVNAAGGIMRRDRFFSCAKIVCFVHGRDGVFGMILYGAIATALTEFTPKRTSSELALNDFVRNICRLLRLLLHNHLSTLWELVGRRLWLVCSRL